MSTMDDTTRESQISDRSVFTIKNKVGFVLALALGLLDVPFFLGPTGPGEIGPPMAVLILVSLCGVVTLGAVGYGWLRHSWPAIRAAAGARIVSMLLAMPALFVEGVPGMLRAAVGASILVTIVTVALMLIPASQWGNMRRGR